MKALASLYVGTDDAAWLVTATPSEAAEAIVEALTDEDYNLVQFTLGNEGSWNGKPLYIDPASITAISPPKSEDDDEDDDE